MDKFGDFIRHAFRNRDTIGDTVESPVVLDAQSLKILEEYGITENYKLSSSPNKNGQRVIKVDISPPINNLLDTSRIRKIIADKKPPLILFDLKGQDDFGTPGELRIPIPESEMELYTDQYIICPDGLWNKPNIPESSGYRTESVSSPLGKGVVGKYILVDNR